MERVNPFHPEKCYNILTLSSPKKIVAFFGMDRVNPFQPKKIIEYEGKN
jgi:hypothetical protein